MNFFPFWSWKIFDIYVLLSILKDVSTDDCVHTNGTSTYIGHDKLAVDGINVIKQNDLEDNFKLLNLSESNCNQKNIQKISSYSIRLKHYPELNFSPLYHAILNIIEITPSINSNQIGIS